MLKLTNDRKLYAVSALLTLLLTLFLYALVLFSPAQHAVAQPTGNTGNSHFYLTPVQLTSTSVTDICSLPGGPPCSTTIYVCNADLSTGGTPTTVTMADEQATPASYAQAVAITANTTYSGFIRRDPNAGCKKFIGGLKVTAGNANALTIDINGRY